MRSIREKVDKRMRVDARRLPAWQGDPDDDKKKNQSKHPDPERDSHAGRLLHRSLRMRHLLFGFNNKCSMVPALLTPVLGTEIPACQLEEIAASALWAPPHTSHIPGEAINIPLIDREKILTPRDQSASE